jgi:hypothetical protein
MCYQMFDGRLNRMTHAKISPELDKRLAALSTEDRIHAIVLLELPRDRDRDSGGARPTRAQRREIMHRLRDHGEQVLPEIDSVLTRFGGHRLADQVNALGSLPVETTAAGFRALAASDRVKAILEDQPVSLLTRGRN